LNPEHEAERFELIEEVGSGGMGVVWRARDVGTGEVVALKLVHPHLARDPDYLARFEREIEIARRIDSPHVVRVIGYGIRQGLPYMAMEYVAGHSLREHLRGRQPLTWLAAKPILRQIALGLEAAHRAGVIHRDVKPSNIMILPDGSVKLADFGIARALELTRLTGSSTMLGTPHYMAPEGSGSAQGDLYALGCVLFEMLTGHPPFEGETQQAVIAAHIREQPHVEQLEPDARPVAAWLLAKAPADRPASATALLAGLDGQLPAPAAPLPGRPRASNSSTRLTITAAGAGALLVAATVWFAANGSYRERGTVQPTPQVTAAAAYSFSASFDGVGAGSVLSWDNGKPLTLCYRLLPENTRFTLEVRTASETLIGSADDNGWGGGDCIELGWAVDPAFVDSCIGRFKIGALVDGTYRGGRVDLAVRKQNC